MIYKLILLSIKNLKRKLFRSVLCILSVSIGVFSVIFISLAGSTGKQAVNLELERTGLGGLIIYASNAASISNETLQTVKKASGIQSVSPIVTSYSKEKNTASSRCMIWAIDSGAEDIVSLEPVKGRVFSRNDINNNKMVCMLDENYAEVVFKNSNPIGRSLTLLVGTRYCELTVIGVIKAGGGILQTFSSYIPGLAFLPYTTYSSLSGRSGYDQIAIKLKDNADSEVVRLELIRRLADEIKYDGLQIENLAKQKDNLNNIIGIVTIVIAAVGAVSIIVSGIGIMTIMLMSVHERTREIGIKKAVGAKKRHITLEFLAESVIISLAGYLVGTLLAVIAAKIGAEMFGLSLTVPVDALLLCLGVTLASGLLFSGYPAYKAVSLRPADAFRQE